jgi:hypothetical protein
VKNTILPFTLAAGTCASASMLATGTMAASIPSGGVATLPPSATASSVRTAGAVSSTLMAPRCQRGTVTGSARTFSKPSTFSFCKAHATALRSPSVPANRGPTSVTSDSAMS